MTIQNWSDKKKKSLLFFSRVMRHWMICETSSAVSDSNHRSTGMSSVSTEESTRYLRSEHEKLPTILPSSSDTMGTVENGCGASCSEAIVDMGASSRSCTEYLPSKKELNGVDSQRANALVGTSVDEELGEDESCPREEPASEGEGVSDWARSVALNTSSRRL